MDQHVTLKVHTSNYTLQITLYIRTIESQLWFLAGRLTDNFGYCDAHNANLNA